MMPQIVLIEDDREIASTLLTVLEGAGYSVEHAFNGFEGRKLIDENPPDLVITDMMMPKMGGFPVLEHLKTVDDPPKVIMITANEGGRHKAYAEMLGVVEYLRKPFAMDVLLEAIERILGKPAPGPKGGKKGGGSTTKVGARPASCSLQATRRKTVGSSMARPPSLLTD